MARHLCKCSQCEHNAFRKPIITNTTKMKEIQREKKKQQENRSKYTEKKGLEEEKKQKTEN